MTDAYGVTIRGLKCCWSQLVSAAGSRKSGLLRPESCAASDSKHVVAAYAGVFPVSSGTGWWSFYVLFVHFAVSTEYEVPGVDRRIMNSRFPRV